MKDNATSEPGNFVRDFGKVLGDYWERFLFLLPNLVFAAVIVGITFFVAGKIKGILRSRLGGKAHDKITAEYIAIISKWVVFIVGLLLAFQALGLSGIAGACWPVRGSRPWWSALPSRTLPRTSWPGSSWPSTGRST